MSSIGRGRIRSLLIVRALPGLGDMLCAVPALRALRRALPDAHIALLSLASAESFYARFRNYLDEFVAIPGYQGLHQVNEEGQRRTRDVLQRIRQRRFDVALQMHGSGGISNALVDQCGARLSCGFYPSSHYPPAHGVFFPYPDGLPEVRRNLRLLEHLGIENAGEQLEFPLNNSDTEELGNYLSGEDLQRGSYACVHPGARVAARRWPPERFAAVADRLAAEGLTIILTGSERERELNQRVANVMRAPARNLAAPMSAGALAALIGGARVLVSNDTGVSHMAAALRVPSVVIFTAADPKRWAPLDGKRHRAVMVPVDCRPCDYAECPIGHPCAEGVGVKDAWRAAATVLAIEETASPIPFASLARVLVLFAGDSSQSSTAMPALHRLRDALPSARVDFRRGDGGALEKLSASAYEAAVILTDEQQSPYDAAYRCYLAGIGIRAGLSVEFGGQLLTHRLKPLPPGTPAEHRHLYLVESLLAASSGSGAGASVRRTA